MEERKSYKFGMKCSWVNNDSISIFLEWAITVNNLLHVSVWRDSLSGGLDKLVQLCLVKLAVGLLRSGVLNVFSPCFVQHLPMILCNDGNAVCMCFTCFCGCSVNPPLPCSLSPCTRPGSPPVHPLIVSQRYSMFYTAPSITLRLTTPLSETQPIIAHTPHTCTTHPCKASLSHRFIYLTPKKPCSLFCVFVCVLQFISFSFFSVNKD